MALNNYYDDYGCFPPAYVADEDGNPLYSWRVLLLPYVDQRGTYNFFRLDEAWNSSHNAQALEKWPLIYQCPSRKGDKYCSSYAAIVGDNAAFAGKEPRSKDDFADGLKEIIMVVEVAESDIAWSEPRDLQLDSMSLVLNKDRKGISSNHGDFAAVLRGEGTVRFLNETTSPQQFKAMCTINGGEKVD